MNNSPRFASSLASQWIQQLTQTGLVLLCAGPGALWAAFVPIQLPSGSYNQDIIVERAAPVAVLPATTASMEGGWTNTGLSWHERGYNRDWPATGLWAPGTVITSDIFTDHYYQLAPNYRTNNVALVDLVVSNATLRLQTPARYGAVSFLLSGMHQGALGFLGYTISHQDGSTQNGSVNSRNWTEIGPCDYTSEGCVNVRDFSFAKINTGFPKLFSVDISITNAASPIASINFAHLVGIRTAVFAVSGVAPGDTEFNPIPVSGYNADIIVEASANRPQQLSSATTASMETGLNNTLHTWFEQGYCSIAPLAGLPASGALLTNLAAPDHVYLLAADYTSSNAVVLDQEGPEFALDFSNPFLAAGLSFLGASASGPCTNRCVVRHQDGSSETNLFVTPDWVAGPESAAWKAGGFLNLNNRLIDEPANAGPALYGLDIPVTNTLSPVTNLALKILAPSSVDRTVVLAVSRRDPADAVGRAVLRIEVGSGRSLLISSSVPGTLESCSQIDAAQPVWIDEGPISSFRTITPDQGRRFWRVRH